MAQPNVVGLIGDVVGSRTAPDRAALQARLLLVLEDVNERLGGQLSVTLGDEFQGRYADLETAVMASLRLHLGLTGFARLRIGIGRGVLAFQQEGESPFGQDGPVWWRAREAVEQVEAEEDITWTRVETGTEWDALLNSYLRMRDTVLARLDAVDAVVCSGLLDGMTQKALAEQVGLNQSSVSRRVKNHGLAAVVVASRFRLGVLEVEA